MRLTHVLALVLPLAVALSTGTGSAAYGDVAQARDGITESGRGVVTADADALAFDVRLGSRRPAPGATPAPGPQSLGDLEAAPRALAAALTAAGAKNVTITFDATLNGITSYPFDVRGTLERPTHDRILSLVLSGALATLPDGSAIPVQAATGALVMNDCHSLETRADAAAFDDAKQRASDLAAHAHLRLGDVRAIAASAPFPACPHFDATTRQLDFAGNPLPLDGPYRVSLTRYVTATFATR